MPAAIHNVGECGMATSANEVSIAPHEEIRTAATQPVPGAVRVVTDDGLDDQPGERRRDPQHRHLSDISAPSIWKMRLTLAFCRPNANWMPEESETHVPDLPERHLRLGLPEWRDAHGYSTSNWGFAGVFFTGFGMTFSGRLPTQTT